MSGTKLGGKRAATTNTARYGSDFYQRIGKIGGTKSRNGGFASLLLGPDNLTGPERASIAGTKGERRSKPGRKQS